MARGVIDALRPAHRGQVVVIASGVASDVGTHLRAHRPRPGTQGQLLGNDTGLDDPLPEDVAVQVVDRRPIGHNRVAVLGAEVAGSVPFDGHVVAGQCADVVLGQLVAEPEPDVTEISPGDVGHAIGGEHNPGRIPRGSACVELLVADSAAGTPAARPAATTTASGPAIRRPLGMASQEPPRTCLTRSRYIASGRIMQAALHRRQGATGKRDRFSPARATVPRLAIVQSGRPLGVADSSDLILVVVPEARPENHPRCGWETEHHRQALFLVV